MKRIAFWALLILSLCITMTAFAAKPGDTVTVNFWIFNNLDGAVSARVGMGYPSEAFDFVSAEIVSPDVINSAPTSKNGKFGLLNMKGLSAGTFATITLRVRPEAQAVTYAIMPVVDSVYNAQYEAVNMTVMGGDITVEHVWDEGQISLEPTCGSTGVKTYSCLYCAESYTESVPATEDHREGKARTSVLPSCVSDGLWTFYCDVCNTFLREEIIPAFGHADGERTVTQLPACNVPGAMIVWCGNCGEALRTESIPASEEHTVITDAAADPTCTETGLTEGKHCGVCGMTLVAQQIIPPRGHTEITDAAADPTCTETGLTEGKHCGVCGTTLVAQQIIPPRGHTEITDAAAEPTCTGTGLTEGKHCGVCGTILVAQQIILPQGHTEITDAAAEPTCTETGLTEGKHCGVCGTILVAQQTVPATGMHTWDEGAVTKEPTATDPGIKTYRCSVCGSTMTEEIPAIGLPRMAGDADENGRVDLADALQILQHDSAEDVSINTSNADVNSDGAADIWDVLLILQYAAGWNVLLK